MKSAAFAIMVTSMAGLVLLLANIGSVSVHTPPGMFNPTFHITVSPGTEPRLLFALLAAAMSVYLYRVVVWTERGIERLQSALPAKRSRDRVVQPLAVKRLKAAIRARDIAAIRRYAAKPEVLEFKDERLLTPLELADLYGDEEVLAALNVVLAENGFGTPAERQKPGFSNRFAVTRNEHRR